MNANQRSEMNNQTNNGGNEKGTPGSKGKTADSGPLDHTYPRGAAQQRGQGGTQQSGAGPAVPDDVTMGRSEAGRSDLPGGSMQTQQTGGTGAVQGITDSHQRAMEERSGAYGQLEQPVGDRDKGDRAAASRQQSSMPSGSGGSGPMNAQNASQPELQGGSRAGGQHGPQSSVRQPQRGSMGNQQSAGQSGSNTGVPSVQQSGTMSAQESTDRSGSQTGSNQQQSGGGTHQSNDTMGGLPRSPGNSGPSSGARDTHLTGAQVHANQQKAEGGVHNSNDAAGGYPKSPGGANKLAADENMDDDTGFSNRG